MTALEIAELTGLSQGYVNRLARAEKLPEPLGTLATGQRVWKRKDIEKWNITRVQS